MEGIPISVQSVSCLNYFSNVVLPNSDNLKILDFFHKNVITGKITVITLINNKDIKRELWNNN